MLLVTEGLLESKVLVKTTVFICSFLKLTVVKGSLLFLNPLQDPRSVLEVSP